MEDFLKYYPEALRLAKRLTKDIYLAEDIVHDVYLRIIKNGIEIDGEKNYKGYLNMAIRNSYFSHKNKKKAHKHNGTTVDISAAFNVAEKISDSNFHDSLSRAIKGTKSNLTLPLMLHVVHDYSYEEIAKIMDIPLGTVRGRIHKAKKELKQKLAA
jgi:RNA polymerase sigma factor (sigma-70 family)